MKKLFALILTLAMVFMLFAACGEKTPDADTDDQDGVHAGDLTDDIPESNPGQPDATEPDATEPGEPAADEPGQPDATEPDTTEPGEPAADEPSEPETPSTVFGTLDKTDAYTLVIETPGTVGNERIGVLAAKGKIEVGFYDEAGTARTRGIEFDWEDMGLEGYPWEYLGAVVEIDESGDAPVIVNTPDKSTFVVKFEDFSFSEDTRTVILNNGHSFSIPDLHYGILRPNGLIGEGGKYIPAWNDRSSTTSSYSSIFVSEKHVSNYYFFTKCDLFSQNLIMNFADTTYEGAALPEGVE